MAGRRVRNQRRSNWWEWVKERQRKKLLRLKCYESSTEPPQKCNLVAFHIKLHTNDMCIDMLSWVIHQQFHETSLTQAAGRGKLCFSVIREYILLSYWWVVKGEDQSVKAALKWLSILKAETLCNITAAKGSSPCTPLILTIRGRS